MQWTSLPVTPISSLVSSIPTASASFVGVNKPSKKAKLHFDFGDGTIQTFGRNSSWVGHQFRDTGLFKVVVRLTYGNSTVLETRRSVRVLAQMWPPQMTCKRFTTRGKAYSCLLEIVRGSDITAQVSLPHYGWSAAFSLKGISCLSN